MPLIQATALSIDSWLTADSAARLAREVDLSLRRIAAGDPAASVLVSELEWVCKDGRQIFIEVVASYLLDEDEVTVGRDSRADILLDDSTVSRSHAVFRRVGDTFAVYDSGSLNGTYVNRQRVDHQQLRNGDEIMIGKFRLVFFTKSAVIA